MKKSNIYKPTLLEVKKAYELIKTHIVKTPLVPLNFLSTDQKKVWAKCEVLQKTGSFKIRGAMHCILKNIEKAKKNGVIAASAGNHAQGVAATAKMLGVKATIVMPTVTPALKVHHTTRWGAEIILHGKIYDESYEYAQKLADEKNYLFVHPYKDPFVIQGQGTLGLEMMDDPSMKDIEAVIISVGGGGLLSGCASVFKELNPKIKIYGVVAQNASAFADSFHDKVARHKDVIPTIADGIAVKRTDAEMLDAVQDMIERVFVIDDDSISEAVSQIAEHSKLVVEGAAGITIVPILKGWIPEQKVAVVLCGGNIDLTTLSAIFQKGLSKQGRLVNLCVQIIDRPGALNSLTQVFSDLGVNILQVYHQRSMAQCHFGEAMVDIEIETRGPEHTATVIQKLLNQGFNVKQKTF